MPPFKALTMWRALISLLLVSSDALTPLVCYVHELCLHNLEIAKVYCTISRLARSFQILTMCSAISRFHKSLDCVEHIHGYLLCMCCSVVAVVVPAQTQIQIS